MDFRHTESRKTVARRQFRRNKGICPKSWNEPSTFGQIRFLFVQNLKNDISAVSARLSRLTDAYLDEALELGEYLERKNALMAEKRTLEEKLSDFERKGNHWLELMRNWIIEANQAGNLIKQENLSGMKDFLVDIGSNRRVAAGMLLAEFKMPWRDLAETSVRARAFGAGEVNSDANQFWWTWGESDPRFGNANAPLYHLTTGPKARIK